VPLLAEECFQFVLVDRGRLGGARPAGEEGEAGRRREIVEGFECLREDAEQVLAQPVQQPPLVAGGAFVVAGERPDLLPLG
jgi:hypothetical protein